MRPLLRPALVPEEIIEAFRAVAPTIEEVARVNDLLIDRYRRGKAAWELRFRRRLGGEACLTVSYRERTGHVLDISATWWVDNVASRTRRLVSAKIGTFNRREPLALLHALLRKGLDRVDAWTPDDLGQPHGPFTSWPQPDAAETIKEQDRLPAR